MPCTSIRKYEHTLNKHSKVQIAVYNMIHLLNKAHHWGTFCVLATIIKGSESSVKTKKTYFINFFNKLSNGKRQ